MQDVGAEAVLRPQVPVLGVRLNARGVGAAVAGCGVPGESFVLHAARAAAAGSRSLVQMLNVHLHGVTDV